MEAVDERERRLGGIRDVVGREAELARLRDLLVAPAGALVLCGGPGIGKTTLWEQGVAAAHDAGRPVLVACPSGAEAELAFAALIDLFDGVPAADEALAALPGPQREALEVALLRRAPAGAGAAPHAIGLALLGVLRTLAADGPVVVAIDDVQWLDGPSADALVFAARRIEREPVTFLLARRPGAPSALERALARLEPAVVEVQPLGPAGIRRLLAGRLGLTLPRGVLRRIADATLGNPLFVLEVGRSLVADGVPALGEDLPVPGAVEELLGTRVSALPDDVRRVLHAVALSADLRAESLAAVAGAGAVEAAAAAGVLRLDGARVRASHPLVAGAARDGATAAERRELHAALAEVVGDDELGALHAALAADGWDAALAARVAAAAASASARGARPEAVQLGEHALRLTPADAPERPDRLLALADCLLVAGQLTRLQEVLRPELASLPAGPARARAWLTLSEAADVRTLDGIYEHLDAALAEAGDDPAIQARVLARKAEFAAGSAVTRLGLSEQWADEALACLGRLPQPAPEVERVVMDGLAWARSLSGAPIDDVCERYRAASEAAVFLVDSPDRVAAQRLVWRGEMTRARATLTTQLALADGQGEPVSYALARLHLCELELRAGEWGAAARLLDEWEESADGALLIAPMYERCRALLAAGRGDAAATAEWAGRAIAAAEATGVNWDRLEALRARGTVTLLVGDPAAAVEDLRAVWAHLVREAVGEPGVFPVAPDLVEALVELGEGQEALEVVEHLAAAAERLDHPWARVSARRCAALLALAAPGGAASAALLALTRAGAGVTSGPSPRAPDAAATLAAVADDLGALGLPFDRARVLLALGRAERRRRRWRAAREALEAAAAAFDERGAGGWATAARSELARVGARRPAAAGELTPAERRVAGLAAEGRSNKEIAQVLFVSAHTVEAHLTNAYAKLGIRGRAQLAARLAAAPVPEA